METQCNPAEREMDGEVNRLIRAARELVDGVRAIPRLAWTLECDRHAADEWVDDLKRELARERAALQKSNTDLSLRTAEANELARACESVRRELTSALETIDALTRWQDRNCDVPGSPLVQQRHRTTGKIESVNAVHMRASQDGCVLYAWRHTPESWEAAKKARASTND